MKRTIKLTESDLRNLIESTITEAMEDEGIGNWVRAGVDALSNPKAYSQGATQSKIYNFANNVRRAKQHYDDGDDIQRAQKYRCDNTPEMQKKLAYYRGYREPGQKPLSKAQRSDMISQIIDADERKKKLDSYRHGKYDNYYASQHESYEHDDLTNRIVESIIRKLRK